MRSTIRDSELHLSWFWPNAIDFVYIYQTSADTLDAVSEIKENELRFYTREEYKANQGYKTIVNGVGRYLFRIFPCQKRKGKIIVFNQENDKNLITITGTKAKIYFSINYKNKFLKAKKILKMSIQTELPLDKDLLVYVRKHGGVPSSIEDGIKYPFIRDFPAGRTELLEQEIGKDEYIRIFFSKGKHSAEIYELIPE
ncbi:beta-mannanase [Neobacillus vireti]|uniref:beta-mannanase n=1 Tax=Neobacillus vireti TaxID=220686 RepID=UPI002FFD6A28